MYHDDSSYCKRCKKLFYPDYNQWDGRDSTYFRWNYVCPKCQKYYDKHPIELKILSGECTRCKNCGEAVYTEELNESGFCEKCVTRFTKYPITKGIYNTKQGIKWVGNKIVQGIIWSIIIAVILAIAYFWIGALIGNFMADPFETESVEDIYNGGMRMKPD